MPYRAPRHTPLRADGASHNAPRGRTTYERGYHGGWEAVRAVQLAREPLCRFCLDSGRIVAAQAVDHILTIAERPDLRLDISNLRSLCLACHNARTARDRAKSTK